MDTSVKQLQPGDEGYKPVETGAQEPASNGAPETTDNQEETQEKLEKVPAIDPDREVENILEVSKLLKKSLERLATVEGYEVVSTYQKQLTTLAGSVETTHYNAKKNHA